MVNYLAHVNTVWDMILSGLDDAPRGRLDRSTTEQLRLRAPGLSRKDRDHVDSLLKRNAIFSAFTPDERRRIENNLHSLPHIVLDLTCLSEDWKLVDKVVRLLARTLGYRPAHLLRAVSWESVSGWLSFVMTNIEGLQPNVILRNTTWSVMPELWTHFAASLRARGFTINLDQDVTVKVSDHALAQAAAFEDPLEFLEDEPVAQREGRPDEASTARRIKWHDHQGRGSTTMLGPEQVRDSKIMAFLGQKSNNKSEFVALARASRSIPLIASHRGSCAPPISLISSSSGEYHAVASNPWERCNLHESLQIPVERSEESLDSIFTQSVSRVASCSESPGLYNLDKDHSEINIITTLQSPSVSQYSDEVMPDQPDEVATAPAVRDTDRKHETISSTFNAHAVGIPVFGLSDGHWREYRRIAPEHWMRAMRDFSKGWILYDPDDMRTRTTSHDGIPRCLFVARWNEAIQINDQLREEARQLSNRILVGVA